jgi:proliferating cell nuclear antigen PCNA
MEFELKDQQKIIVLIQLFEEIHKITNEANINFDCNKMHFQCLDEDKSAIMLGEIHADWFDNYNCKNDITIGINLEYFIIFLKSYKKDGIPTLKITFDENNQDKLFICFHPTNTKNPISNTECQMNLFELEHELMQITPLVECTDVVMPSSVFVDAINNLKHIKNAVKLQWNEDAIVFSSTSPEIGTVKQSICVANVEQYGIVEYEDQENILFLSNKKLELMASFCKLSKKIKLEMVPDVPLYATYYLFGNVATDDIDEENAMDVERDQNEKQQNNAFFQFILSPKTDDN